MRQQLQPFLGETYHIEADVSRYSTYRRRNGGTESTCLLKNIILFTSIEVPVHHLWLCTGKSFRAFNPHIGDRISFNGKVCEYYKFDSWRCDFAIDYFLGACREFKLVGKERGIDFRSYLEQKERERALCMAQADAK